MSERDDLEKSFDDTEGSEISGVLDEDRQQTESAEDTSDVEEDDSKDASSSHDAGTPRGAETPRDVPRFPSYTFTTKPAETTGPVPFSVEKECFLLLLEARMILREMMEHKLKQERILTGNLTVNEIQNLLKSQTEDADADWISQIQELKRNLVAEIRRNHNLEIDTGKLDKRIALLIKNRGDIQAIIAKTEHKKTKHPTEHKKSELISDPKKVELYANLFYLLQTEPRYLANLVFLVTHDQMSSFMDTVILTLFGDAFSPREEFLILSLFKLAMLKEMSALSSVGDLLSAETVVIKMVLAYNKRKQGLDYLKSSFGSLLQAVVKQDMNLEMRPISVYQQMISETEIRTGEKSTLDRNLSDDQIVEIPEIKATLKARAEQLISVSAQFLDAIVATLARLPYGMRWICKQVQQIGEDRFPGSVQEVLRVVGYFVYYRFINVMIVTPSQYKVVEQRDVNMTNTKNLVAVGRVLQQLFNLSTFPPAEKWMQPVNDWLLASQDRVRSYMEELLDVPEPEDSLRVDRYVELTQRSKPVIIISLHEIAATHTLISKNIDSLGLDKDDHLRIIMRDLSQFGAVPEISPDDDREVQLTLTNRFEKNVEAEVVSEDDSLHAETKEHTINALRLIPVTESGSTLLETLTQGLDYAQKSSNGSLQTTIKKVLDGLKTLETKGRASSADSYSAFLKEVALEVANRQAIREQQKKEVRRLTSTLKNLTKHQQYLEGQIKDYNNYLQDCLLKHYQSKNKKKKGETKVKPFKFSYSQLKKRRVLLSAENMDAATKAALKKTDFSISSEKVGVFIIKAKLLGTTLHEETIRLDELLERNANGITKLEINEITLDVNMTIHLLNKLFMK